MANTTHRIGAHELAFVLLFGCSLMACGSCGGGEAAVTPTVPTGAEPAALFDQEGTLSEASEQVGRVRMQRYDVAVAEVGAVVVTVSSSAFDPVVYVTTADGRTLSNDDFQGSHEHAQLQVNVTTPGTLKVAVTSHDGQGTGRYRVLVRRVDGGQPAMVAVGGSRPGDLAASDPRLPDGRPYDTVLVQGPSVLTVNAEGTALPQIAVMTPEGHPVFQGNDGAWALSGAGVHRVQIMAPTQAATAHYIVNVAAPSAQVTPTLSRNHHQLPPTAASGRLSSDQAAHGDLSDTDGRLPTGEPADIYSIDLTAGQELSIALESGAFDSYLMVIAPNGQYFENDDDGGTLNSRLTMTAPVAGSYRVVATAYRATDRGAYEIKIGRAASVVAVAAATGGAVAPSGAEQHLRGELAQGDQTLSSGELYDEHTFALRQGQTVRFRAQSSQFDTYLIVRPPAGAQVDNDDAPGGGTDAQVDLVAQQSGEYRVQVTSYRPGESGGYDLVVTGAGASGNTPIATPTPGPGPQHPPTVATGNETRGTLSRGDQTLQSGEFSDRLEMSFTAGQSVQLRLASTQFDPYIIVRTPSGRQMDNDDFAPGSTNAGVDIPVAEAGAYAITVTSYRPGETGAYVLSRSAGASVPRPVAQGGQTGQGAQGGRVFGLFAGISDYPGPGDLPECANDAVKLAETLRNEGLLAVANQVVLTDSQATVGNIRSAMQRMQSQVGPNDIFIFFYSGHGGQTSGTQDAREIDGVDEYLAVYDGQLVDDELGRLFDGMNARISLVALDSCHSGGFAKDIITRPGRVGLFSSEEDVLSAVAGQFQAGGYLSHFLRMAMAGEADANPHDGVLTVGELTHDVYTQFGSHAQDINLAAAYQHLVMDRGAVGVDQVLWSTR